MGAKNHAIIMPDASMDATLNTLAAAGFGAAGQRCMALSTAVFVGGSILWYFNFKTFYPSAAIFFYFHCEEILSLYVRRLSPIITAIYC